MNILSALASNGQREFVDEYEKNIIAASFVDEGFRAAISELIDSNHFLDERHAYIFRAIMYLAGANEPVTEITVCDVLRSKAKLEFCGGASYVSSLAMYPCDVTSPEYYAEKLKSYALTRDLVGIANSIVVGVESGLEPNQVLLETMDRVLHATDTNVKSNEEFVGDITQRMLDELIHQYENDEADEIGISTGYPALDELMLRLKGTDLHIFAARPSLGKSAFATNICMNVARQGIPVLFCSLEMSKAQLTRRMLAIESGVPYVKLLHGNHLSVGQLASLKDAQARVRMWPFVIDDKSKQTVAQIKTKARRMQAKRGLGLLVVDYLQLMCDDPEDKGQISAAVSGVKAIAKDLDIPVILISQMSRYVEHRDTKRPQLSDLKGSSQIEQDADLVGFLHVTENQRDKMTFLVEKHRNGPTGIVRFDFDRATTKYTEPVGAGEW